MLTKHDWTTLAKVWPSLLLSRHSEKPSVAKLLDQVFKSLQKYSETFAIHNKITEEVVNMAWDLIPLNQRPAEAEMASGLARSAYSNKVNEDVYESLVDKLCEELETRKLHWRHYNLGLGMLTILTRSDIALPRRAVKLVVENLTHDNLLVRKCSIHVLGSILKQHKRPHPKIPLDPNECLVEAPGDRGGNLWLCYNKDNVPKSLEDWDQPRYVHKTHYGYYMWPRKMLVYAPSDQQPPLNRSSEDMNAQEAEIFKFFSNEAKLQKLIEFLSLEEQKGVDHFDARRFFMFKGLFRNFGGSIFLHLFRDHLERLVEQDQESAHRCAAEVIAGIIRGSKHWPWDMTTDLWSWLQPLLQKIVSKITVESFTDWGTCFATSSKSRDPHRIHWMLEALMDEPIQSKGSFTDCSRLYALQGALAQQEWRIPTLMHKILEELKPFMTHSLLNVRDRLGSMLTNIFISDLDFSGFPGNQSNHGGNKRNPKIVDFINEVVPQLEMLASDDESSGSRTPIDVGSSEALGLARPPLGPETMMMRMLPPELLARLPRPPGPRPEMLLPRMPNPGQPGLMPMLGPDAMLRMLPPEFLARLPRPPGPEMLARMPGPEMLARMPIPGPEMLLRMPGSGMALGPPHPHEMMGFDMMLPEVPNGLSMDPLKEEKQKAIRLLQAGEVFSFFGFVRMSAG